MKGQRCTAEVTAGEPAGGPAGGPAGEPTGEPAPAARSASAAAVPPSVYLRRHRYSFTTSFEGIMPIKFLGVIIEYLRRVLENQELRGAKPLNS